MLGDFCPLATPSTKSSLDNKQSYIKGRNINQQHYKSQEGILGIWYKPIWERFSKHDNSTFPLNFNSSKVSLLTFIKQISCKTMVLQRFPWLLVCYGICKAIHTQAEAWYLTGQAIAIEDLNCLQFGLSANEECWVSQCAHVWAGFFLLSIWKQHWNEGLSVSYHVDAWVEPR